MSHFSSGHTSVIQVSGYPALQDHLQQQPKGGAPFIAVPVNVFLPIVIGASRTSAIIGHRRLREVNRSEQKFTPLSTVGGTWKQGGIFHFQVLLSIIGPGLVRIQMVQNNCFACNPKGPQERPGFIVSRVSPSQVLSHS